MMYSGQQKLAVNLVNNAGLLIINMEVETASLWPPYVIRQAIIFLPCGFFLSFFLLFYSLPNLSGRRLDVYHTSTHGVALVLI